MHPIRQALYTLRQGPCGPQVANSLPNEPQVPKKVQVLDFWSQRHAQPEPGKAPNLDLGHCQPGPWTWPTCTLDMPILYLDMPILFMDRFGLLRGDAAPITN